MREALALRHRVTAAMREFLDGEGFLDIETPVLTRSTPEGARDFLVPSRLQQGSFYALPQSPQLFKQLLMVAGFERYYQIARCFRDEDLRADRQPDFTQLDIEMSFVDVDDVIEVNERLLAHVFERVGGPQLELPMRRLPYDEAIARFGTDRPDTRFGLELVDLADALAETEFKVFRGVIDSGGAVRGINAGAREMPRSALDGLISRAQELGAKGLVWAFREGDGWRSPTAKFLSAEELDGAQRAPRRRGGRPAARRRRQAQGRQRRARPAPPRPRGRVRPDPRGHRRPALDRRLAADGAERGGRLGPAPPSLHRARPATSTRPSPGAARALAYDVVWNGQEMGGGSIRISDPELQGKVFAALGIDAAEAEARFGFLLEALRYGAPPHGGIAYGLDRIVQRLAGADSIRDVIAFPKTASGADALTGAPAPVDEPQLREVGLQLRAQRPPGSQ